MKRALMLLTVCSMLSPAAQANDSLAWLQKMANAAQRLNYTGIFTYQSGSNTETSRIVHVVDAKGEREKLEVLDGSPRKVIRINDEVRCFLPDEKLIIVERRSRHKSFPALLPESVGSLEAHYRIDKKGISRVAGLDSQLVVLVPRDSLRYGYQFWADTRSGLILKARTLNEEREIVEQFAFSQLQIDAPGNSATFDASPDPQEQSWRVRDNTLTTRENSLDERWVFREQLPGFQKAAGMSRKSKRQDGGEIVHFIFSDGLASISVFIESSTDPQGDRTAYSAGATNVYNRVLNGYHLTILGEVPMNTLKRLGDSIESRRQ